MWKDVLVVGRSRCRLVLDGKFYYSSISFCASAILHSLNICGMFFSSLVIREDLNYFIIARCYS